MFTPDEFIDPVGERHLAEHGGPIIRIEPVLPSFGALPFLDEAGVDVETGLELVRVAERLMDIADAEPVGPGTPRLTVAGAAVYVADRLTEGKAVTQAEVVAAVEETIPSSKWKLKTYGQELHAISEGRLQPMSAVSGLVSAD